MKHVRFIILAVLSVFCLNMSAQGIRIYKSDSTVIDLDYAQVDSIVAIQYIGYEDFVDMGLSVKWAKFNVGATAPEEYGDYFAYAETYTKEEFTEINCMSYCKDFEYVSGDDNYDAARVVMGAPARIPTLEEIQELEDNTTSEWTTLNGVNGRLVTSKINGNTIFFPAAGRKFGSTVEYAGEDGYYWSVTPFETLGYYGYYLGFYKDNFVHFWTYRYYGQSVRAVRN